MSKRSKKKRPKKPGPAKAAASRPEERKPGKRPIRPILLTIPAVAAVLVIVLFVWRPGKVAKAGASETNLLIVTIDTCRADHLGAYGKASAETPNIDRLAAQGVLFENCLTPAPLTLPAHCSIFTGDYPPGHKVRNNGTYVLGPERPTLAGILRDKGYQTSAFVASFVLLSKFGLNRGFDDYDDSLDARSLINNFKSEIPAGDVYEKFKFWFGKNGGRKFFAWIHLYDPHVPYAPPKEFASRFPDTPEGRYDGEISYADSVIGRVLADLRDSGMLDQTLVVVCADHGEAFGEHDEIEHGIFCYQDTLRVPLIISNPGLLPKPARIRPTVSLTDVMPTVLELVGIAAPAGHQGRSLVPLIRKGSAGEKRDFYLESLYGQEEMGWAPLTGLISGRYKLISLPQPEIYDLETDPNEKTNLAPGRGDLLKELNGSLSASLARLSGAGEASRRKLSAEDQERLRALGYVSSPANKASTGLDPKLGIVVDKEVRASFAEAEQGKVDEAEARLNALRGLHPGVDVPLYYDVEYIILRRRNKVAESRALMARAVSKFPQIDRFHMLSTLTAMEAGDLAEAERNARDLLKFNPTFSSAYTVLGQIAEKRNDRAGAIDSYKKALALEPQNISLKSRLAEILMSGGDYADAAVIFDGMLDNGSVQGNAELLFKIALFYSRYGSPSKAEALLRRTVSLERNGRYLFMLAIALAKGGNEAEALPLMKEALNRRAGELTPDQIRVGTSALESWEAALKLPRNR